MFVVRLEKKVFYSKMQILTSQASKKYRQVRISILIKPVNKCKTDQL